MQFRLFERLEHGKRVRDGLARTCLAHEQNLVPAPVPCSLDGWSVFGTVVGQMTSRSESRRPGKSGGEESAILIGGVHEGGSALSCGVAKDKEAPK
jgi:hypothetical protein